MNACAPAAVVEIGPEALQERLPWGRGDQPKFTACWSAPGGGSEMTGRFLFKTDAWRYPVGVLTEQCLQNVYHAVGIEVPQSFLVTLDHKIWLASRWFIPEGSSFYSGTQILGTLLGGESYIRQLEENQATRSAVSVGMVKSALAQSCGDDADSLFQQWVKMVLMDALVGNTDRSPENWGVLYNDLTNTWTFAPVYDTSRALLYQQEEGFLARLTPGTKAARKWVESYCHGSLPKLCYKEGAVISHFQLAYELQTVLPFVVESWWVNLLIEKGWNVIETTARSFQSLVSPNRLFWWLMVLKYRFNVLQKGLSNA